MPLQKIKNEKKRLNPDNYEITGLRTYSAKIFSILKKNYPDVKCALIFENPLQLLIATILSAQCTDARVNIVTKNLFQKYKSAEDFVNIKNEELEKDIYSTGFYRQKANSIKRCCEILIKEYNGKVPADFDLLRKLPGVGRKTASVVAGNAFGIPAVAVDTHVIRLSNIMGFIDSADPEKIEKRLKELLPEEDWVNASHYLATHGRQICFARKPLCNACLIGTICPGYQSEIKVQKSASSM